MNVCPCMCANVCVCGFSSMCAHVCLPNVCVCVCPCVCAPVYVCSCVYAHVICVHVCGNMAGSVGEAIAVALVQVHGMGERESVH